MKSVAYVGKIFVHDNFDPPRRLMEECLEELLDSRGEYSLVTIEYLSGDAQVASQGSEDVGDTINREKEYGRT